MDTQETSREALIGLLKNIPVFDGLGDKDLLQIVPLLRKESYPAESIIIREGDRGESMYILVEGVVRVARHSEGGEEIALQTLQGGAFFGEFSLIDNLPRSATVAALVDTDIFTLQKSDFDTLLARNVHLANVFYRNCLTETFSRFRNIVANFTFSQHSLHEKSAQLDVINLDLSYAKRIQHCFINSAALDCEGALIPGVRHTYIYRPCLEVGGDFLNVVKTGNGGLSIIIADVVGHGITAALATGVLKSGYSLFLANHADRPADLMSAINRHFSETLSHVYATCYCAHITPDAGRVTFAKGGHHHPLFWSGASGDFLDIKCPGTGIGISASSKYPQVEFRLGSGDRLLFFTDGVIEQHDRGEAMYTEERLRKMVRALIQAGRRDVLEAIMEDLAEFAGVQHFEDDVTMLLLEFD